MDEWGDFSSSSQKVKADITLKKLSAFFFPAFLGICSLQRQNRSRKECLRDRTSVLFASLFLLIFFSIAVS